MPINNIRWLNLGKSLGSSTIFKVIFRGGGEILSDGFSGRSKYEEKIHFNYSEISVGFRVEHNPTIIGNDVVYEINLGTGKELIGMNLRNFNKINFVGLFSRGSVVDNSSEVDILIYKIPDSNPYKRKFTNTAAHIMTHELGRIDFSIDLTSQNTTLDLDFFKNPLILEKDRRYNKKTNKWTIY